MNILHINPNSQIAAILQEYQTLGSNQVDVLGVRKLPYGKGCSIEDLFSYINKLSKIPDLIHLHDLDLIVDDKSEELFSNIHLKHKTRLVLSLGIDAPLNKDLIIEKVRSISPDFIERCFEIVLVHDANLLPIAEKLSIATWLPYPVRIIHDIKDYEFKTPEGNIAVQTSYPENSPEYNQCDKFINQLREEGHKISLIPLVFIDERLDGDSEIFIDRLDGEGYGYLTVLAMAAGRTVLATNPPTVRNNSKQLEMSSVLDTNWSNLKSRIESLLKERRSIRDLSKRSLQYVATFHSGDQISSELVEMYRQTLNNS